jgi:hypothetical protein
MRTASRCNGRQLEKRRSTANKTLSKKNLAKIEALSIISQQDKEEKIKDVIETGKKKAF